MHTLGSCPYAMEVNHRLRNRMGAPFNALPAAPDLGLRDRLRTQLSILQPDDQKLWKTASHLATWFIWKERNSRIFNRTQSSPVDVLGRIIEEAKCWHMEGIRTALRIFQPP